MSFLSYNEVVDLGGTGMKKVFTIVIGLFLLLIPLQTIAKEWNEWNQLVDESLQLVKQDEYEKAKQMLSSATGFPVAVSSQEHSRVISLAYDKALEAIDIGSKQDKEDNLLALRLVIDAEGSNIQPLWLNRQETVISAFQGMEASLAKQDNTEFQYALNQFLRQFDIIYPSLTLDLSEKQLQQLNSDISYLDESRNTIVKQSDSMQRLQLIRGDVESVFLYPKGKDTDFSLVWMMIMTGGIIIFTLTYVGFRKYKGEQEKKKQLKSKDS